MNDPIQLLKKLVEIVPVVWVDIDATTGRSVFRCEHCDHEWVGFSPDEWDDECQHKDDCTWRLAVEYLANLENPGYVAHL